MSTSSESDTGSSSESENDTDDASEVLVASIVTLIAMDHSENILVKERDLLFVNLGINGSWISCKSTKIATTCFV